MPCVRSLPVLLISFCVLLSLCCRTSNAHSQSNNTFEENLHSRPQTVRLMYDRTLTPVPIVYLILDGKEPLPFLVDSGTNGFTIEPWAAEKIGLTRKNDPDPQTEQRFVLKSVHVQTMSGEKVPVRLGTGAAAHGRNAVFVISAVPPDILPLRVAGILGIPLFNANIVQFDFVQNTMTFLPPDTARAQRKLSKWLPLQPYAKEDVSDKRVAIEVKVGNHVAKMLVDTGAEVTTFAQQDAQRIPVLSLGDDLRTIDASGKTEIATPMLLANVQIGDLIVSISYAHRSNPSLQRGNLLGMNLLERFVVTIDVQRKRLLLEPNLRYTFAALLPATPRLLPEHRGNQYFVKDAASSLVEKGCKPGDRIVSIDGVPVDDLVEQAVRSLLTGWSVQEVCLVLERAGKQIIVRYLPAPLFPPDTPSTRKGSLGIGFEYNLSGYTTGESVLTVKIVAPASAASRAGLQAGDEIIRIEEFVLRVTPYEAFSPLLDRETVTLTVKRLGQSQPIRISVKRE